MFSNKRPSHLEDPKTKPLKGLTELLTAMISLEDGHDNDPLTSSIVIHQLQNVESDHSS